MEIAETNEQTRKSSFWSGLWFPLVLFFSAGILRNIVSQIAAWIIASLLATFISYFAEPKLKVGFVKFFVVIQALMLVFIAALMLIPPQLAKAMPEFWAYAVPVFLLFNAVYFVPSFDGRPRGAWWKWVLGSCLFAAFFGWIISF
jgi:hypothetical protein